jgi:hypothetical protein
MTPNEAAQARLRIYIVHCIDHMQDHIHQIQAQCQHLDDDGLRNCLDDAVAQILAADRALEAALQKLGGFPEHDHGHANTNGEARG